MLNDLAIYDDGTLEKAKNRFHMAMTPAHFLAHLLDPRYRGEKLELCQRDEAMEFLSSYHMEALPDILNYIAKCGPFKEYLFKKNVTDNVVPLAWWKSLPNIQPQTLALVEQLHTATASSAGLERMFSTFGFVHSKVRNKLGVDKAAKLVSVFRFLNAKD